MAHAVIAIAGSSGLIGSALVSALRATDHRVVRIVRRQPANADEVYWNPDAGDFDWRTLRDVDAVVNLCGVSIGSRRWSGAFKQSLRDSRIVPTEVLTDAVVDAGVPVLINASAVGFYGNTRDRIADEQSPAGTGFLARLCLDWEAATRPTPVSASCSRAPAWCWRRQAACWPGSVRSSGSGSVPGWAAGASTCRGSRWRTRCGPCCSR